MAEYPTRVAAATTGKQQRRAAENCKHGLLNCSSSKARVMSSAASARADPGGTATAGSSDCSGSFSVQLFLSFVYYSMRSHGSRGASVRSVSSASSEASLASVASNLPDVAYMPAGRPGNPVLQALNAGGGDNADADAQDDASANGPDPSSKWKRRWDVALQALRDMPRWVLSAIAVAACCLAC